MRQAEHSEGAAQNAWVCIVTSADLESYSPVDELVHG